MGNVDWKRNRLYNESPIIFIFGCLVNYRFNSFRNFLIYIFHFSGLLELRINDSSHYTNEQLAEILDSIIGEKIEKKHFYELTNCNKNTFNKYFKNYFEKNGHTGQRKFTFVESYNILTEWQGKGNWSMMNAIKKEKLIKTLNTGNYKKLANEVNLIIGKENYKHSDKLSPKMAKQILKHLDLDKSSESEQLLHYSDFKNSAFWAFGFLVLYKIQKNHSIQETNKK